MHSLLNVARYGSLRPMSPAGNPKELRGRDALKFGLRSSARRDFKAAV